MACTPFISLPLSLRVLYIPTVLMVRIKCTILYMKYNNYNNVLCHYWCLSFSERALQDGLYYEFCRYSNNVVVRLYGDSEKKWAVVKYKRYVWVNWKMSISPSPIISCMNWEVGGVNSGYLLEMYLQGLGLDLAG